MLCSRIPYGLASGSFDCNGYFDYSSVTKDDIFVMKPFGKSFATYTSCLAKTASLVYIMSTILRGELVEFFGRDKKGKY